MLDLEAKTNVTNTYRRNLQVEKNALANACKLVQPELQKLSEIIEQHITSSTNLASTISQYLINNSGKRIRALLVLLATKCFPYTGDEHINLAAVLEFFHSSSLLHDDVIDNSELRRGQTAANKIWGNKACVLVGDFLFAQAFALIVSTNSKTISNLFSQVSQDITQGEIEQLTYGHNLTLDKQTYQNIIQKKTATLFTAACQIGPLLSDNSQQYISVMQNFGKNLGIGFQIIDDILDYTSTSKVLGKKPGDDFFEHKITLPVIEAYSKANSTQKKAIQHAFAHKTPNDFITIQTLLHELGCIKSCYQQAEASINAAVTELLILDESKYRDALETIAAFVLDRDF